MRKADKLTTILCCCLGTLTSWNPLGLSRPLMGLLYLYLYLYLYCATPVSVLSAVAQQDVKMASFMLIVPLRTLKVAMGKLNTYTSATNGSTMYCTI